MSYWLLGAQKCLLTARNWTHSHKHHGPQEDCFREEETRCGKLRWQVQGHIDSNSSARTFLLYSEKNIPFYLEHGPEMWPWHILDRMTHTLSSMIKSRGKCNKAEAFRTWDFMLSPEMLTSHRNSNSAVPGFSKWMTLLLLGAQTKPTPRAHGRTSFVSDRLDLTLLSGFPLPKQGGHSTSSNTGYGFYFL